MGRPSTAETVRQLIGAHGGTATRAQVLSGSGLREKQVDGALETLVKAGHLQRIGRGAYSLLPDAVQDREAPIEEKIWRAMRINDRWTISDIAVQAGTTPDYVRKRMRFYRAEGMVRQAGERPVRGGSEKVWRLSLKARDRMDRPRIERWTPDPLVSAAVALNRLICTGLAQRFEEQRAEAVGLCDAIRGALEGREDGKLGSRQAERSVGAASCRDHRGDRVANTHIKEA